MKIYISFCGGTVSTELFQNPMHDSSTIARNENIFFIFECLVSIKFSSHVRNDTVAKGSNDTVYLRL